MSHITTLSGRPPEEVKDGAPAPIDPATGQHKDHWVLSDGELAQGFVRPVRLTYMHKCGGVTSMPYKIAETWARDPKFYGRTFCVHCKDYLPVAEFKWDGTDEVLGSERLPVESAAVEKGG